jgi:hypothetical protein
MYAILLAPLIGAPISISVAWWSWVRSERSKAGLWRARFLLAGLLAGSVNVAMYYAFVTYRLCATLPPKVWTAKGLCGDIGGYLTLVVLGGAIFGQGVPRIPLAVCAILGYILWVLLAV